LAKDDSMSMGALADDYDDDEYGDEEMYGPPPRRGRRGRRARAATTTDHVDDEPMPGPGGLEGGGYDQQVRGRDDSGGPDLRLRVITGVVMGVIALAAFAAGRSVVAVLVAA